MASFTFFRKKHQIRNDIQKIYILLYTFQLIKQFTTQDTTQLTTQDTT